MAAVELEELRALVAPIMRRILPPQFALDEQAVQVMTQCAREFASAVSCEALTLGGQEHKSRVTGFDITQSLSILGLRHYRALAIEEYLFKRQQHLQVCQVCSPTQRCRASTASIPSPSATSVVAEAPASKAKKRNRAAPDTTGQAAPSGQDGADGGAKRSRGGANGNNNKKRFEDPGFLQEIMERLQSCQDKNAMVRSLAKEFGMPIRDIKAVLPL